MEFVLLTISQMVHLFRNRFKILQDCLMLYLLVEKDNLVKLGKGN